MKADRRPLVGGLVACLLSMPLACHDLGYDAPAPPPRVSPESGVPAAGRVYEYDHQVRTAEELNLEDFLRLYELAGHPTFAILVNRYPVENNPALESWEAESIGERELHRVRSGSVGNKEVRVESGTTNVEVIESTPEEGDSTLDEVASERRLYPRAPQPQSEQLNELQVEDRITSILTAAGIKVVDADTLKTKAPPLEPPGGTIGAVPGAGVQVVVKYDLVPAMFRISIKAVRIDDGRLVAHASDTLYPDRSGEFDMDEIRWNIEDTARALLAELVAVWKREFGD